jgi:soluble lytic murein transglycosylase
VICLALIVLIMLSYWAGIYIDILRVKWRLAVLIPQAAATHKLDPLLVKAVVIEESSMNYRVRGKFGEIGLMQVTPGVLKDYAKATGRVITQEQLFVPETNLEVGCWYLARMMRMFRDQREPVYFALAAYNAGMSKVEKWIGKTKGLTGQEFLQKIEIKGTRAYVSNIVKRWTEMAQQRAEKRGVKREA